MSHLSFLISIMCRSGPIWLYWPKSRWRGHSVWRRSTAQCTLCVMYKGTVCINLHKDPFVHASLILTCQTKTLHTPEYMYIKHSLNHRLWKSFPSLVFRSWSGFWKLTKAKKKRIGKRSQGKSVWCFVGDVMQLTFPYLSISCFHYHK